MVVAGMVLADLAVPAADTEALWYLTRGTGLVSLVLLTVVVALGIAQVRQWAAPGAGWPQLVVSGLHRNASLLTVVFLGLHIAASVIDGFAPIDWLAAVVPFESPYRRVWLGLGALAFDLLVALVITSLLRRHLGHRTWSLVHGTAYACWPLALVHGLGTGSDGTTGWVLAVDGLCLAAVLAAVAWRLAGDRRSPAAPRLGAGLAGLAVTGVIVAWAMTGPARPGWARRAGTPAELLAPTTTTTTTTVTR
jgi:DMSO/TMAO reductase YedYZ heme-binding membrane subunit